jgi:hypothetical protein
VSRLPDRVRVRLLPLLIASACSSSDDEPATSGSAELVVAASDYSSSQVCAAPGGCRTGADLGKDPMLAATNGRVFFVARDKDLLIELDPASAIPLSRTPVRPEGSAIANPHDVAASKDGTLFVPLYNLGRIAIVKDGKLDANAIDLSSYDADGNPEADAIRIVEVGGVEKAFVTLERLTFEGNALVSKQTSQMLRIDVASRTVEATIELAGRNPFNPMTLADGALYMAEPGNFDAAKEDGAGIERFDVATSTSRLVVPEKDLEGSVAEVAVDGECGAAIVAGPEKTVNPTSVIAFHARDGKPSAAVLGPTAGYDLQGLAWRGNLLYVGDRRELTVHVFERDGASCALRDTGRTIPLPQRPVALRPAK